VVGIHAIGGMAGGGKIAFAVHTAHRLADRLPRGPNFLPLPRQNPRSTTEVPAAQFPVSMEAQMALWRDRLAERQLLLVLDDAASSDRVRPLLPGVGGRLVLVTSRRHLF